MLNTCCSVSIYGDDDDGGDDYNYINKDRWIRNMRVNTRERVKRAMLKSRKGSSGCGGLSHSDENQAGNWCNCSTYCYNCPAPGKMKQGNKGHKRDRQSTVGHCTHMKSRLNSRLENCRTIKQELRYHE